MPFGKEQREARKEMNAQVAEKNAQNTQKLDNLTIFNTDFITDKNIETIGLVSGSRFVLSVIAETDINRAINDMKQSAVDLGADAIIGFRYAPSTNHAYVWGTAVKFI